MSILARARVTVRVRVRAGARVGLGLALALALTLRFTPALEDEGRDRVQALSGVVADDVT